MYAIYIYGGYDLPYEWQSVLRQRFALSFFWLLFFLSLQDKEKKVTRKIITQP